MEAQSESGCRRWCQDPNRTMEVMAAANSSPILMAYIAVPLVILAAGTIGKVKLSACMQTNEC